MEKNKKIIFIAISLTLVGLVLLSSCGGDRKASKTITYQLVKAEKELSFPLDDRTKSSTPALFPYTGKDGKEYLSFQNSNGNEILFYGMTTRQLEFKVYPKREGDNGVGQVGGFYVHNLDSIFLAALGAPIIYLIDSAARVKDKLHYDSTSDGTPLIAYTAGSSVYKPLVLLEHKLFILPYPNRALQNNSLCSVINLVDKTVSGLDVQFPKFPYVEGDFKAFGAEGNFSRCFDGKQFAYSFYYDEDIYITDINHTSIRKIKAKSRYINRVGYLNDFGATFEESCTNPNYGNMIYDKYREVYYRVAYPKAEIEKDVRALELIQYGRKNFSILILNKDFKVVGETKFPDYTYNSVAWFVGEDGLYISASHFMNPSYSDDWLVFHRFDLVEKKE